MTPEETIERYRNDPQFYNAVNGMVHALRANYFTREELLDAAALACTIDEKRQRDENREAPPCC